MNWTVNPKPLDLSVNKIYNGNAIFSSGFTLSGMVNGDSPPILSGVAMVAGKNAGTYSNFDNSTLTLGNSNYTLVLLVFFKSVTYFY